MNVWVSLISSWIGPLPISGTTNISLSHHHLQRKSLAKNPRSLIPSPYGLFSTHKSELQLWNLSRQCVLSAPNLSMASQLMKNTWSFYRDHLIRAFSLFLQYVKGTLTFAPVVFFPRNSPPDIHWVSIWLSVRSLLKAASSKRTFLTILADGTHSGISDSFHCFFFLHVFLVSIDCFPVNRWKALWRQRCCLFSWHTEVQRSPLIRGFIFCGFGYLQATALGTDDPPADVWT